MSVEIEFFTHAHAIREATLHKERLKSQNKCRVFVVVVYPDAGCMEKWKTCAKNLGIERLAFSNVCECHPHNTDLADLIMWEYLTKPTKIEPLKTEPNLINENQKQVSPILGKPQVERKSYIIYKAPLFPEPYNYEWLSREMWDNYLSPECQSAIK